MRSDHLHLLCCPESHESLNLHVFDSQIETLADGPSYIDVHQGMLISPSGHRYPIVDGIPRMLPMTATIFRDFYRHFKNEIKSLASGIQMDTPGSKDFSAHILPTLHRFGMEWTRHCISEKTWGLEQDERIAHLLHYMNMNPEDLKGKFFLDAGAGTGQLTASVSTLSPITVGIDLAKGIAQGWRDRKKIAPDHYHNLLLVQGNLLKPPFRPGTFDFIHSSGVLHHTPTTRTAFESVSKLVAPGGKLGVWLYKKTEKSFLPLVPFINTRYLSVSTDTLRTVTPKLPPGLLFSLIYIYAFCFQMAYKVNQWIRGTCHQQTIRERVTSLFDNLAPPYVWRHDAEEVIDWFEARNFINIRAPLKTLFDENI